MLFSAALFAAAADAVTRGRVRARCRSPLLSSRSMVINPFLSFDLIPWVGHLNPPCAHHTLVRGFRFDAARMALGWRHHTLIQALLSRGPMTEESFYPLFAGISGKNPATHRQVFNETLLKINKALAYVQFELRACCNQYDGKVYYSVVNNVVDEQSKLGSKYSYVYSIVFEGKWSSVARIVPYAALHYMAYEQYRRWIILGFPNIGKGPVLDLVSGSIAGGTAVIFTYPLDLVRTKLAYQIVGPSRLKDRKLYSLPEQVYRGILIVS